MTFRDPRFVIAYTIIILFTGAYAYRPDATMNGALIAAFAGAWGFYLGSSSSSAKQADTTSKALDIAAAAQAGPAITSQPGQALPATPEGNS
jgi:hypothetical protein